MRLRKKLLRGSRFYLLIDRDTLKRPAAAVAAEAAGAGIDIIQLRDKRSPKKTVLKTALLLKQALKDTRALFIVNDYADIARLADSDGLHLGQSDMPLREARRLLGKEKIIGVSCHNLKQAREAVSAGADYLAIGPVFRSATKSGCRPIGIKVLKEVSKKISIPVFAIGNINRGNLETITACGIKRVAVCGAVLKAKDSIKAAKEIVTALRVRQ